MHNPNNYYANFELLCNSLVEDKHNILSKGNFNFSAYLIILSEQVDKEQLGKTMGSNTNYPFTDYTNTLACVIPDLLI